MAEQTVISVRDLVVGFGSQVVLDRLSLDVHRGEILGIVGGSGSGKSVLLRAIIGLLPMRGGTIEVLGTELSCADEEQRRSTERRWGVLFQQGALFSSLSVLQNVQFPMREYLSLSKRLVREMAEVKLDMVGLRPEDWGKFPSELSGGMTKRVALARALAQLPERTRAAFELHRLGGKTQREVAADLGISTTLVNFMIRDAMACCRDALRAA